MPVRFEVRMPECDTQISEFRLQRWLVEVGDDVVPGTALCELIAVKRKWLRRQPSSRNPLSLRRRRVEKRDIRADQSPTVAVIAAESGIVSVINETPGSAIETNDLLSHIDIGTDSGAGGRFNTVAEILPAAQGS